MLKVDIWSTVKILKGKGRPIKEISRVLNISRNSVKKIIRSRSYKEYVGSKNLEKSRSRLTIFHDEILQMSTEGFIGSRILEELKEKGFTGSKTAFYDYLKKININLKTNKITQRYETAPGVMSQYDWSPFSVEIGGKIEKVFIFCLLLSWSRFRKYTWALSEKQGQVFDGIEEGFFSFGGVTEILLIDNHKTMVSRRVPHGTEWNQKFYEFMGYLGIEPRSCSIRNPRAKGKVENPFFFLEQHFLKGRRFRDFSDFSRKLEEFNDSVNKRVHGTTKRTPEEMFSEERKFLREPPQGRFIGLHETFRKVNWDCLLSFEGNKYSVPYIYAGKSVWVRTSQGRKLLIHSQKGELIAEHDLSRDRGKIIIEEKHYEGLRRNRLHSKSVIIEEFKKLFPDSEEYIEGLEKTKRFNVSYHLNKIIELTKYFSIDDIKAAIEKAIQFNVYSSDVVTGILRSEASFQNHPPNRLELRITLPEIEMKRDLSEYEKLGGMKQ